MNIKDLKRLKKNQDRQDFERCVRGCGYDGPLTWNESLQSYDISYETAMFAGFKLGLKFKEGEERGD